MLGIYIPDWKNCKFIIVTSTIIIDAWYKIHPPIYTQMLIILINILSTISNKNNLWISIGIIGKIKLETMAGPV